MVVLFPFEGEITQYECQLMVEYMAKNRIAVFTRWRSAETQVAHKHGWAVEYKDGYMHTMGDAGIFYTHQVEITLFCIHLPPCTSH